MTAPFHNQMGVLTGSINITILTVNNSEFAYNGVNDPNSGHIGHGLYAGNIQSLTINNSLLPRGLDRL